MDRTMDQPGRTAESRHARRTTGGAALIIFGLLFMLVGAMGSALAQPGEHGRGLGRESRDAVATTTVPVLQGDQGANASPGPYDPSGVGLPSGNGNGEGQAVRRPAAGTVGNADTKNPPGQMPGPSDANSGYECDTNRGIGQTNPAHSGCVTTTVPPTTIVPPTTTTTAVPGETTTTVPGATTTVAAVTTTTGQTQVLGEEITRSPSTPAGNGALAFTGPAVAALVAAGLLMLTSGLLLLAGRSPHKPFGKV